MIPVPRGAAATKAAAKDSAADKGVTIVVSSKDSKTADTFIWTFMEDFMGYAKRETEQGNGGASTWDEIDNGIYKMARNDGAISCDFPKGETCTFTFKDPVDPELKVPVCRGEGSSSLANDFLNDPEGHLARLLGEP